MSVEHLEILRLGQRGEGVAEASVGTVYLPFTLPGDVVAAQFDNGTLQGVDVVVPRADRLAPVCPYFGTCGGCAVQALPAEPYRAWKQDLVADALRKAGLPAVATPLVEAHGAGRRRATFHSRLQPTPNVLRAPAVKTGFMRARSHDLIDIAACPVLAPELDGALPAARRIAEALQNVGKPLDIVVTATDTGLDVDLRGLGPLQDSDRRRLALMAAELDLARLSNHGDVVLERRSPSLRIGVASLVPPPGAFLQAAARGEAALGDVVMAAVGGARKVADLFCGVGTFALRLATVASVVAVDLEGPGLAALSRAARLAPGLKAVSTEARDLFRRPLHVDELAAFEAVVFDPPRAGALAQAEALAASAVPVVVAVSCNPVTFARDAAVLVGGGYSLERVVPVDQFLFASHVEMVGVFRRPKATTRPKRRLFG
ncbi:RNA methyltransferase [Lichenihabitans sp. Uapishka_5]|uniref:class I SAM-dependent RNA methyltransferase n=1 Tax=Lichenihabitans sp. Uapishka_5 TaxID=3037302 RepID=UPI0029E7FCF6|nr:RNA methyltransferase [Lichenihabitans sp. Uapishka_5]MDX7950423.1 RNA methyltransferase [Lichenihabitans sp. Uapishka_5]